MIFSQFSAPVRTLFIASALALVSPRASGTASAIPEVGRGDSGAEVSSNIGSQGSGGGPLKHISTTVTTIEIWIPLHGWTVICEFKKVKCGPKGSNCPLQVQA